MLMTRMAFHSDLGDGYSSWPSAQTPEKVTGSANVTSQKRTKDTKVG